MNPANNLCYRLPMIPSATYLFISYIHESALLGDLSWRCLWNLCETATRLRCHRHSGISGENMSDLYIIYSDRTRRIFDKALEFFRVLHVRDSKIPTCPGCAHMCIGVSHMYGFCLDFACPNRRFLTTVPVQKTGRTGPG